MCHGAHFLKKIVVVHCTLWHSSCEAITLSCMYFVLHIWWCETPYTSCFVCCNIVFDGINIVFLHWVTKGHYSWKFFHSSLVAKPSFFQCADLGFTNYNPYLISTVENPICFTFDMSTPLVDPIFYHKVACKLWHLATTCLKVAYVVTIVSHYTQIFQQPHLDVAITIFQYSKALWIMWFATKKGRYHTYWIHWCKLCWGCGGT
jgi:hypothetical protein